MSTEISSVWDSVWTYFGFTDISFDASAYDIAPDRDSADYIFGFYWWHAYRGNFEHLIVLNDRSNAMRTLGYRDAQFQRLPNINK